MNEQLPGVPPAKPSPLARAWRAVRGFVSALTGPDKAADDRMTRQSEVLPRNQLRGPFG